MRNVSTVREYFWYSRIIVIGQRWISSQSNWLAGNCKKQTKNKKKQNLTKTSKGTKKKKKEIYHVQ